MLILAIPAIRADEDPQFATTVAANTQLVALFLASTLTAPLAAHAAVCEAFRRQATFGDAWSSLWRNWPTCLVIAVCQLLAVGIGSLLLVVPGFLAAVAFCLAIPLRIVEGGGPFKALRRSVSLGAGNRWRLLAYLCLSNIAVLVFFVAGVWLVFQISEMIIGASPVPDEGPATWAIVANVGTALMTTTLIALASFLFGLVPAAAATELLSDQADRALPDVFD